MGTATKVYGICFNFSASRTLSVKVDVSYPKSTWRQRNIPLAYVKDDEGSHGGMAVQSAAGNVRQLE